MTTAPGSTGPEYEPLGPWWTYDAPSVRIADPFGEYVSIWTTGSNGDSVLLVPATTGDHRAWEPDLTELTAHFVVHALDLRHAGRHADVDGVVTAVDAVGADLLVAAGDAATAALGALERGAPVRLTLWEPPADIGTALRAVAADQAAPIRVFSSSALLLDTIADAPGVAPLARARSTSDRGAVLAADLRAAQSSR